jgi:hypothetical protein
MKGALADFCTQEVIHVKREANEAARGLAKQAARDHIHKVWMKMIPTNIFHLVTSEQYALFV